MKFEIERKTLSAVLTRVGSIVNKINTIPILGFVRIAASGESVTLSATDLNICYSESVPATVETPGEYCVPAVTLSEIVKKLPGDGAVSLAYDEHRQSVAVKCGRSRFALGTRPAVEMPALATPAGGTRFAMPRADLCHIFDRTRFAMSSEQSRYYLCGIYFHIAEGVLRGVATDGHRLAMSSTEIPVGAEGMPGVIIPRQTVAALQKVADTVSAEQAEIAISDVRVAFTFGGASLVSKVIDGSFPDYLRVIPRDNRNRIEVDRRELVESAARVAVICSEKARSINFDMHADGIMLHAVNPEGGEAVEEIDAKLTGEPATLGFSGRYLADTLAQIEGTRARIEYGEPLAPVLLSAPDGGADVFVLMPRRV